MFLVSGVYNFQILLRCTEFNFSPKNGGKRCEGEEREYKICNTQVSRLRAILDFVS